MPKTTSEISCSTTCAEVDRSEVGPHLIGAIADVIRMTEPQLTAIVPSPASDVTLDKQDAIELLTARKLLEVTAAHIHKGEIVAQLGERFTSVNRITITELTPAVQSPAFDLVGCGEEAKVETGCQQPFDGDGAQY